MHKRRPTVEELREESSQDGPGAWKELSYCHTDLPQAMNHRIALEELNRDLGASRAKVEGWAQSKISAADKLREQHLTSIKDLKCRGACQSLPS